MFKSIINQLTDTQTYGVVSICMFVAIFAIALVWAAFMKKTFVNTMSALPLDDGETREKGPGHE